MKATYIGTGDRSDDHICTVFGRDFPLNEAVDVSDLDEGTQGLLAGNPTFETDGDPAPAVKPKPPPKAAAPAPAPAAPKPADTSGL